MSPQLSPPEKERLLGTAPSDVTLPWLRDMFARGGDDKRRMSPQARFRLTPADAVRHGYELESSVPTTAGRWVFNLFAFERMRKLVPYFNKPIDKKELGRVDGLVAELLVEGALSSEDYMDYIDRMHWFSFSMASFMAPTLDLEVLEPLPEVLRERDRLLDGVGEGEMTDREVKKVGDAERKLLEMARRKLSERNGPGKRVYDSGAAGSFENNYKNTAIMRGVMSKSSDHSKRYLSKSNLMDGHEPDETHLYADLMVRASFSRSVLTQDGGYLVKKFNAAFGHVVLDERGTDCGTKRLLDVKLTERNMMDYHMRHAPVRDGWTVLTRAELEKRVGKTVSMRSPLYCVSERICNRCAGDLFHNLGTRHIASIFSKTGSQLLNASLKAFHDLSLKTVDMDVEGAFRRI